VDKCLVNPVVNELDVTCMPSDLPEFIAVDLSTLKKSVSLHLKDIKLPKGVSAVIRGGQNNNPVLVSVTNPVVEVVAPVADAAPAADAKGKGKGKK
jgi:large subunit ribosomal protein L25